jgi:hypothetical protein
MLLLGHSQANEPAHDVERQPFCRHGCDAAGTSSASLPAVASGLSPYEHRVFEVAARERDRVADKLWRKEIVGIADFAQPSWKPRFHLANLEDGSIRSYLTAHGKGSDPQHDGWLKSFSNVPGSEATSRGAYLTCEWCTIGRSQGCFALSDEAFLDTLWRLSSGYLLFADKIGEAWQESLCWVRSWHPP